MLSGKETPTHARNISKTPENLIKKSMKLSTLLIISAIVAAFGSLQVEGFWNPHKPKPRTDSTLRHTSTYKKALGVIFLDGMCMETLINSMKMMMSLLGMHGLMAG